MIGSKLNNPSHQASASTSTTQLPLQQLRPHSTVMALPKYLYYKDCSQHTAVATLYWTIGRRAQNRAIFPSSQGEGSTGTRMGTTANNIRFRSLELLYLEWKPGLDPEPQGSWPISPETMENVLHSNSCRSESSTNQCASSPLKLCLTLHRARLYLALIRQSNCRK